MAIKKQPSIFTQIVKIAFLGLFFVSIYTAFRIMEGYTIAKSMSNIFEGWPINTEANRYTDIKNKNMTNDFISNVIINQIYNEDIKDDLSPIPGNHYLKYFNYFMGMRITYNRAELQQRSSTGLSGKPSYRISNYNGNPNIRFSNIITDPFGRNETEYQENEGYKNTGGYVFYFDSNLTYEKADEKYREIVEDGLFDEYWLSIVLEIMIYNCNYQTGVIISYEFLVNNAGNVFKDKNIDAFYMSRYSSSYNGYSQFLKYLLIFIDATFGLYYIIICILLAKKLRKRFYDLWKLKHNSFIFVDYLEMCNWILIFIWFVFWALVFCFPPAIKLPTNNIADFEKYRLLADRTTYFSYITSLATIPILFRWFIYISVSYPSFRGLFDTVIIALKDLVLIFVSLLIAFWYSNYCLEGFSINFCITTDCDAWIYLCFGSSL